MLFVMPLWNDEVGPLATALASFLNQPWSRERFVVTCLTGCLARFACTRKAVHDGGDHSIILGQVDSATHRPGLGLMFKRGQYGGFLGLE